MDNEISNEAGRTTAAHERIERTAARVKEGTSSVVGGAREKFDSAAERVESGLHRATDATARGAERATEKAAELRERSAELAADARQRTDAALGSVREFVREKPVQSVAIALAAGWLLGRLLSPRR
ncbi:MAG TPA: hypothetical protein VFK00_04660 [Rhodanobacteraceae bacterium]|jgi:ElaB/YqjD/DUF883 family membrane-anchored ribosome-binding protein|nr:hypothetical protein [Rhodanobacteraceae bacterium]